MRSRLVVFAVLVASSALPAAPAAAESCLLGILCAPRSLPVPVPSPAPAPALPPADSVTQPVTDTVSSVQSVLKTPVSVLENQMLALINADRNSAGIPALQASAWAQSFARQFSEKMMAAGTIWHNPEYFSKGRAAMGADMLAENVAYDSSIPANHAGLMNSPGHRANILDGRLTHVGIGVAVSPAGRVYVTEDFARIPGSRHEAGGTIKAAGRPGNSPLRPAVLQLAGAKPGAPSGETSTITLLPPAGPGKVAADAVSKAAAHREEGSGGQSPAPMIPGLLTGGAVLVFAPAVLLLKKLLFLLGI